MCSEIETSSVYWSRAILQDAVMPSIKILQEFLQDLYILARKGPFVLQVLEAATVQLESWNHMT